MTIAFTMSLPEHTTIIENYEQIFGEHTLYKMEWNFPEMPRIGENVDGAILNVFIDHVLKDKENLPLRWHITDVKWINEASNLMPVLHVVGKWAAA